MNKKLNLKILFPDEAHRAYCPSIIKGFALLKEALIDCLLHGKKLHVRAMYSQIQSHMEKMTKKWYFRLLPIITEETEERLPNTVTWASPYGVGPKEYAQGVDYDSICPNVKKVFDTVKKYSCEGYAVLIISDEYGWGDLIAAHVRGTEFYIQDSELVLAFYGDLKEFLHRNTKIVVVSCTSTRPDFVEYIINDIRKEIPENEVLDKTFHCPAVKARGQAALALAEQCDKIILIGNEKSMQVSYYGSLLTLFFKKKYPNDRTFRAFLFAEPEHVLGRIFSPGDKVGIISATSTSMSKLEKFVQRLQGLKTDDTPIEKPEYDYRYPGAYMCPGTTCKGTCGRCC